MSITTVTPSQRQLFQQDLLTWFDSHGRKSLPWQKQTGAYGIWVSEIMLQQTQVETVIPYYQKFMRQFPNITRLAQASIDDVLTLWSGLGYYARARNLYKSANIIYQQHNGVFPDNYDEVIALPGIGRSTAAAILAFAFDQHHSILDGNVKRVITRFFAISGNLNKKPIETQLWQLVDKLTPKQRVADYTQAIMDLGATVCTRSKPTCTLCPLKESCQAYQQNRQQDFPSPKVRTAKPRQQTRMLMIYNHEQHIFLEKRPPTGIWGGLWSLPQIDDADIDIHQWCQSSFAMNIEQIGDASFCQHSFTHFTLEISVLPCRLVEHSNAINMTINEPNNAIWITSQQSKTTALPAAIKKILQKLC